MQITPVAGNPAARAPGLGRGATAILGVAALLLTLASAYAAGRLARDRAAAELHNRATAAASLASASLAAVIDKQRLVPTLLARNPEVIALLAAPVPPPQLRIHLDAQLAEIATEASSSVLYLLDREGVAVSSSNAAGPDSFVGIDYGFRSYFTGAMDGGTAQQYALGTVSGRPGLYLSRRIDSGFGPVGVAVAKVEFDALEDRWRQSGLVVQVTDADGVVLSTTEPAWRFGTIRPVSDEAAVRSALQLGEEPLGRVPVERTDDAARIDGRPHSLATTELGPSAPGWSLSVFLPSYPALASAERAARIMTLLAGTLASVAVYGLIRRRRGALARQEALRAMNAELERRVAVRTGQLAHTNAALNAEIADRAAAETRVRSLREELAQANRLSILGQVTAGVAHEINQPLAAIRTYAETGGRLLDVGHADETRDNLRQIVGVTERIGAITRTLRGFARRGAGELRPIVIEEAIDGATALLAGRIRDAGVTVERTPRSPGLMALAGRIRLEQILVNLLQNALDAVRDTPDPRVTVGVVAEATTVAITIADNGPGLSPEAREQLFMPFNTTKATGLGLGLVISADLAREFGGSLRLEPPDGPGAAFALELPRAS